MPYLVSSDDPCYYTHEQLRVVLSNPLRKNLAKSPEAQNYLK